MQVINTIGRRKASVVRLYMSEGKGEVIINGKDVADYFPMESTRQKMLDPFKIADKEGQFDLKINVNGGGFTGQSEAIRLALSRALVKLDEELKTLLKAKKYMTRDSRVVERKKYGKPKARKSFQFSKR